MEMMDLQPNFSQVIAEAVKDIITRYSKGQAGEASEFTGK